MSIQSKLESLDRRKRELLHDASKWPASALHHRSDAASWCALDILDHLARTEAGIAEAMRQGLARPVAIPSRDRLGGLMVLAAMYAPTRIKIPSSATQVIPQTPADLANASSAWDRARAQLHAVVADISPDAQSLGIFRHPVGGWMTPERTLSFMDSHLAHHKFQWKRLKRGLPMRENTER